MTKLKYTPEIRERAVQLLIESEKDYPSNWAAITAIAPKIGCTPETLRVWYQKYLDKQNPEFCVVTQLMALVLLFFKSISYPLFGLN
jgi:transposase